MGSDHFSLKCWSKSELLAKEEEAFPFSTQPPMDSSASLYYNSVDWQNEFPIRESSYLMGSFYLDHFYASLDIEQSSNLTQGDLTYTLIHALENVFSKRLQSRLLEDHLTVVAENNLLGYENGNGFWSELGALFEPSKQMLSHGKSNEDGGDEELKEFERNGKRCKEERCSSSKMLSKKVISQYFYMPITQAAKELNVGLTLLKKRCRELGIRRWPHRKLMSLQTLIKNVQELQKEEGEESERKLREALEVLERERKMLEEMPDLQLEDKTKRLRQACFKANYKKRKLMTMESQSSSGGSRESLGLLGAYAMENEENEEEMKSLMSDSFSSNNIVILE